MIDKIKVALDAAKVLFSIGARLMDAIRDGDLDRVDEILPPEDRARLHLLEIEERARRDLPTE